MKKSFFQKHLFEILFLTACVVTLFFLQKYSPIHLNNVCAAAVDFVAQSPFLMYLFPGSFLAVCYLLLALAPVFSARFESKPWRIVYFVLVILVIAAWRWPFLCLGECNMDESQNLAVVITLFKDPAYWRSVDPGSHGPLTELPLVLGRLAGFAPDFALAKSVNLSLIIASTCFFHLALSRLFTEKTARLACIPMVLFFSLTHYWDFLGFNAEAPLIFLLALALSQLGALHVHSGPPAFGRWYLLGLILGSVPYSKLQGVPIALVAALWGLVVLVQLPFQWKARLRFLGCYVLGGFSWSIATTIYLIHYGIFHDFIFRYLVQNFLYSQRGKQTFLEKINAFIFLIFQDFPINIFFKQQFFLIIALSFTCIVLITWSITSQNSILKRLQHQKKTISILFTFIYFLVCVYCVCIPGHIFRHYLLLLVPGICLFLCALLYLIATTARTRILGLGIAGILFASLSFTSGDQYFSKKMAIFQSRDFFSIHSHPASQIISQLASDGDSMVVWGWFYRLHVETEIPMGTRTTPMHIFGIPELSNAYLQAFMQEMNTTKPELFIEAVGPGMKTFTDRNTYGVDAYPEVRKLLDEQYTLLAVFGPMRFYRRMQ